MRKIIFYFLLLTLFTGCAQQRFTREERLLINNSPKGYYMRTLQNNNPEDSLILRKKSKPLSKKEIHSPELQILKEGMLLTVQNPEKSGVGIAAPQVGINKQIIIVKRIDKPDEPFETYINPCIEYYSEKQEPGPEGCLSVPETYGEVVRSQEITISYLDEKSLTRTEETITGFTAIIFQHEIDHLNGILFTDRMTNVLDTKK